MIIKFLLKLARMKTRNMAPGEVPTKAGANVPFVHVLKWAI